MARVDDDIRDNSDIYTTAGERAVSRRRSADARSIIQRTLGRRVSQVSNSVSIISSLSLGEREPNVLFPVRSMRITDYGR